MRKNFFLFLMMMLAFASLNSGCGGSSSPSLVDESSYNPPNLTEEQLIELAETQVDPSEFDLAELNELYADSGFKAADIAINVEEQLARRIWLEAAGFFAGNGKYSGGNYGAMTTSITEHPQPDGSIMLIRQSRFLYVYRWTDPDYEVFDERITSTVKQHKYTESGCQHGVHGTDCVGLIWNAAYRAGITLWAAEGTNRRRWGPSTLTTASKWKEWFKNAKDVSSEIGSSKPQPGDIVSYLWYDKDGNKCEHVGIAAKVRDGDNDRIVIIHCAGRTESDYTCEEYKTAGETSSILNERYPVNGVTAHEYNANSGITYFGLEKKRLRLYVPSEQPEEPTTPNEPTTPVNPEEPTTPNEPSQPENNTPSTPNNGTISASSLNGTWTGTGSGTGFNSNVTGPVSINTEVRYTISNVSEESGTADIQIYDRTTNSQYGIDLVRNWQDASQFSMKSSGTNSWTFSREYSDGADTIIITLDDESNGTLILNGGMFNEDNPSDYTTYDITCKITKQ